MARGRGGHARQAKDWVPLPSTVLALTASGTFGAPILNFTDARTILRMLGEYVISLTGAAATADQVSITVALGLVSSDAAAVGASALPDPNGEPDYPWLYWASHMFNYPQAIATGGDSNPGDAGALRRKFDARSMRKVKARESLVWVVEYMDIAGTPPITVQLGITRVLVGRD